MLLGCQMLEILFYETSNLDYKWDTEMCFYTKHGIYLLLNDISDKYEIQLGGVKMLIFPYYIQTPALTFYSICTYIPLILCTLGSRMDQALKS